jgi:hypothetical protein
MTHAAIVAFIQFGTLMAVLLAPVPLAMTLDRIGRDSIASLSERLLGVAIVWMLIQLATAVLLGLVGQLSLPAVLEADALMIGLAIVLFARARTGSPTRAPLAASERVVIVSAVVLGTTLFLRAVTTVVIEPDSLGYHLPAVAQWYQAGKLWPLERSDQIGHYPYAWELFSLLFVLPFGDDGAVLVPNVLAWGFLGLALYRVARELGTGRLPALVSALAVLGIPLVRHVITTLHVDLALAAFFVAAVASTLGLARTRTPADAVTLGAALAITAAVKIPGLVYDAALLTAAAFCGLIALPRRGARRVLLLLGPAAIVGSVWYVANLLRVGNPLGLVRVEIAGVTLFPGTLAPGHLGGLSLLGLFRPTDPADWSIVGHIAARQLALPFIGLVAAAVSGLFSPPSAWRRPRLFVTLVALLCALLYAATPFSGGMGRMVRLTPWMGENLRYALPFVALMGPLGAVGLDRVSRPGLLVAGAIAIVMGATNAWLPVAAVVVSAGAGIAIACHRWRGAARVGVATAGVISTAVGVATIRAMHVRERATVYGPTWAAVARAVVGPDEPVGVLQSNERFLLYGADLRRPVRDITARTTDRAGWMAMLEAAGIRVVAVGPTGRRWPEFAWLDDPSGPFERVEGNDPRRELVLYRLRSATTIGASGPIPSLAGRPSPRTSGMRALPR